jgi:predicted ATPase/DNA-binding SARP family transcriptional activator
MEFRVLGPLGAQSDEREVPVRGAQQRRLLAVLLVHAGTVVSVDRLADELWDGRPPAGAAQGLWTSVARLRRLLAAGEEPVLATRAPGYVLQVVPEQVDAGRFERLLAQARRTGTDDPQATVDLLDQALTLWRGPAFVEFATLRFAAAEAARLDELRLVARELRFEAELARGGHGESVAGLQAFVAEHPLRESPRAQLMLALYRSGRQAEALEEYRHYRDLIRAELGLEPSVLLRSRHGEILRQSADLDLFPGDRIMTPPTPVAARGARRTVGRRPPIEITTFVGRGSDIAAATDDVAAHRLVTLTGVGGVGKTRLAIRVAEAVAPRFPDGVAWCELAPLSHAAAVEPALATALGVQRQPGTSTTRSLISFLATRRLLLVIDNCEHVLGGVRPLVAAIVRDCPQVVVLATGRTALGLPGERRRPVPPLPLPGAAYGCERDAPAVALFVDRARAVRPGFDPSGAELGHVVDICRRLDGLPLAIELAAARVRSVNPVDLAERLTDPFALLTGPAGTVGDRHGTLLGVLDWSYGLLGPAQQRLFDRSAVFAGGFDLAAAEEVCAGGGIGRGDVLDLLTGLVDASMAAAGPPTGEVRYSQLETLREYGRRRLRAGGELDTIRLAHARHYAALAGRADRGLRGPDEPRWVEVVDRELDNLRAAHRWAVEHGDTDLALRITSGLRYYALYRFRDEVVSWGEAAIELPGAEHHALFALACGAVGEGLTARGELGRATALAERLLARATDLDDVRRIPGLRVVGMAALYEGRLDDGFGSHEEMLRIARLHDDPYEMGMALLGLAQARVYAGDMEAGAAFAEEQYGIALRLGNPSMLALALYDQAEALSIAEPELARGHYQRAIGFAVSGGSSFIEGIATVGLAALLGRSGRPGTALPLFRTIIDRWHDMGVWQHQWTTLRNLVHLLVRTRRHEDAAVLLGAIAAATTAAPAFGTDAERMAQAGRTLADVLGGPAWAAAVRRGGAMAADDAVAFAKAAVERALRAGGVRLGGPS